MFTFRRFIGAAALASAVLLTGCKGNPAAPQGNYGTVVGIVKSTNGQPIAAAVVTVDSVLVSTPTGADGKYTIQTVPIDSPTTTSTVTCHASGYRDPPAQHISVAAGKQTEADFTLAPQ